MKPPISAAHAALAKIGREHHAHRINRIANHPEVQPYVAFGHPVPLDFTAAIADESNVLLASQHGCILFHQVAIGIYDAHSMVLPEGRGDWAMSFARACMLWMFSKTDCFEIMAMVPKGNVRVHAFTRSLGFRPAFQTDHPARNYSLTLQEWLPSAAGLEERARWAEQVLEGEQMTLFPRAMNADAYRSFGMVMEMFLSGQVHKAAILHARWAKLAGFTPCQAHSERVLSFEGAMLALQGPSFYPIGMEPGASLH